MSYIKKTTGSSIRRLKIFVPLAAAAAVLVANIPVAQAANSVTITSPTSSSQVKDIVTLKATASTGVKGVQFKLGGQKLGPEDTTYPYSYDWNTTGTANIQHQLTATARFATTSVTSPVVTVNTYNPPFAGTVEVVGDSISQQAFDPDADNTQTFTTNAPAVSLRNIYVKMGWAAPHVQSHVNDYAVFRWPERLIVALGTNDATTMFGSDGWTNSGTTSDGKPNDLQNFRTLINTVHPTACVVLVLPYAGPGADVSWATQINRARTDLTALATERPHTLIADWKTVIDQHPEYMDEDGIHLLTPYTTPTDDLIAASEGRLSPVDPAAAEARQQFYWSSAAQCTL